MRIFGVDFTSAPTRRKPITLAYGVLSDECLRVESCVALETWEDFEGWLASDGPWVAACDFPFGQPRMLLENLGWSLRWEEYVYQVAGLGKEGFEESIKAYCAGREAGN